MKASLENTQEPQRHTLQRVQQESSTDGKATINDNRTATVTQRKLRASMDNTDSNKLPVQRRNNTGLPDNLKSGIENLSGYSMDDVKVHYNSSKPAQLQAHAYAQGTDIHLAPGQEKHLPHEAWHVVQQKQGRVQPTRQLKSKINVNDDVGLEKEADVMGNKALNNRRGKGSKLTVKSSNTKGVIQMQMKDYLVSMDNEGKIGSIYVNQHDRIRLVHSNGPSKIVYKGKYDVIHRYSIDLTAFMKGKDFSNDDSGKDSAKWEASGILEKIVKNDQVIPEWAKKVESTEEALTVGDVIPYDNDYFLVELKQKEDKIVSTPHVSRGKLVKLSLDDEFVIKLEKKIIEIENKEDARKKLDTAYYYYREHLKKNNKRAKKYKTEVDRIAGKMNKELLEFIGKEKFSLLYAIHDSKETIEELKNK
ncbi:DUF4157 domain-containing protein [Aquimarina sp. MMG016]|uniref:eCIS core domain-containing protein n=1 Tax=Aquimarina sp. MMG016 TaxID=2822690 RepID=UPI001B3A1D44|nr:DUF4157 domain-containing protein [Aquimarina sp. MMG016]MBQ4820689.1 DUF4157 domain-containing protein [Aquimarina sp. MMG016]